MPTDIKPLPHIRKIAVLRANALGDFMFVLPALDALRRTYPKAEIVYFGKAWHAEFAPIHVPSIDRVVAIPRCRGVGEAEDFMQDETALDQFFNQMRGEHFDLALQMHGGGRYSNQFVNRLGATHTVGSRTPGAEALDISIPFSFYQNEVLRYLEIVSLIGATAENIVPHISTTSKDAGEAHQLTGAAQYVILHPGASDPRRRWPAAKFADVARHFLRQGLGVYVTGAGPERAVVEAVVARTEGEARNTCDTLTLGGLAALLAGAQVTISNDTGPLHLARAVGCPTVGLYWCGNYITAGPMRLERHQSLLSWIVACPECGTSCVHAVPFDTNACSHAVSFIQDIQIDQVLEAAEAVRRW